MTQEFKPGDTVRFIDTDRAVGSPLWPGAVYTVNYVRQDGLVCLRGMGKPALASRFELVEPDATQPEDATDAYVEPEPLKEGRWYQVWAKFVREDKLGALVVATPTGADGEGCRNTYAHPNAIVRTEDAPPWVKPVEEPMGLGAVVEARQPEFFGRTRFIRRHPSGGQPWQSPGGSHYDWEHLGEPVVLSDGYVDGGAS